MPEKPSKNPVPAPAPEPERQNAQSATARPPAPMPVPGPTAGHRYTPAGVPTFESVREKIENRYGTAQGAHELAAETPEGRNAEEQYEARQKAAAERLEQIRSSMHSDSDTESGKA